MKTINKVLLWSYYIRLKIVQKQVNKFRKNTASEAELINQLNIGNVYTKIAAAFLIIQAHLGITLHDEQLIALMAMLDNKFVDVKTGEGKTMIVAAFCLVAPKPIHVVTVNEYLASYAASHLSELYTTCGLTVNVLYEDSSKNSEDIYSADIVYGTTNAFCFKYVIDRFKRSNDYTLHTAVIDEADYVCIDNATSSCSVGIDEIMDSWNSSVTLEVAKRIKDYLDSCTLCQLTYDEEVFWNDLKGKEKFKKTIFVSKERKFVDFTQDIIDDLYLLQTNNIYDGPELVSIAIGLATAMFVYEKMVNYIVVEDRILLVDQYNGRILPNSKHDFYLNIGLLIKENIFSLENQKTIGSIATQVYFLKYVNVVGLSGSLVPVQDEIYTVFKSKTVVIPKHLNNKIYEYEHFVKRKNEKFSLMKKIIEREFLLNRPILVITKDDYHSKEVGNYLQSIFPNVSVFNNEESYENEQQYIDNAGNPDQITVSTMLFGRGIDITPKDGSELVVIMFENYGCPRLKLQIAGRTGRQGVNGHVHTLISPEDFIFNHLTERERSKINKLTFQFYTKKAVHRINSFEYAARERTSYFEFYFDLIFDYYYRKVKSTLFDDFFLEEMERIKLYRFSNQEKSECVLEVMKEAGNVISTILYNLGGKDNA